MARFSTSIDSTLSSSDAFAYLADFTNARSWDPGVREATRLDSGPLGVGSEFDLIARFAGRDVPLRYTIVIYEPSTHVVFEAQAAGFIARDTIEVGTSLEGSTVLYDAELVFSGRRRALDPLAQRLFDRIGRRAAGGLRAVLNP